MKGNLTREYKGRPQIYNQEGGRWKWRYAERRNCQLCGVEFLHPIRFKNERQKGAYCSTVCRDKANAIRFDKQRPRKNCVICGKQFIVPKPNKVDKYATCSVTCRTEYRRRRKIAYWAKGRAHEPV